MEEGDPTKIVNPAKLTPQRASETCATCHDRRSHALWSGSQHDSRNVGCVTCHSVHGPKGPKQIKAASELAQCASCHRAGKLRVSGIDVELIPEVASDAVSRLNRCESLFEDFCIESVRQGVSVSVSVKAREAAAAG